MKEKFLKNNQDVDEPMLTVEQPVLSVLHPTRKRPAKAETTREVWLEAAKYPERVEYIFGIDEDDASSLALLKKFSHVLVPPGGGCVRALNACAQASAGVVLISGSDDLFPPEGWDEKILERIGDASREVVLDVSDGLRDDGLMAIAVMTRARYERLGYFIHPAFKSVYADNWHTAVSKRDEVIVPAKDLIFEHRHFYNGFAEWDEVYAEQNSPERYAEGQEVLDRLLREEF